MPTNRCVLLSMLTMMFACGADEPSASLKNGLTSRDWRPLGPTEPYAGKSLSEWSEAWFRWSLAQTSCDSPATDLDGSKCALYQDGEAPVFFLAFAPSLAERSKCVLPTGKALLVPVAPVSIQVIPGEEPRSEQELRDEASSVVASMRDLTLKVDGEVIDVSEDYVVGPMTMAVEIPPAPNLFSCRGIKNVAEVVLDPVVGAGYFALLPPPPEGEHRLIHTGVASVDGFNEEFGAATRLRVAAR